MGGGSGNDSRSVAALDSLVGEAGRLAAAGDLAGASERLLAAVEAAREASDPRTADVALMAARVLSWGGRAAEAVAVLDPVDAAEAEGRPDLLLLRADLRAAAGRPGEALDDLARLPTGWEAQAADRRLAFALAGDDLAAGIRALEDRLPAEVARGGAPCQQTLALLAGLYLQVGRADDARSAWESVARGAEAAGVPGLGVQARAFLAREFARTPEEQERAVVELRRARADAVEASDPVAYAVAAGVLARLLTGLHRDVEAVDAVFRARASLADLMGEVGKRAGDALVVALREALGAARYGDALDRFIATARAAREGGHA